MSMDPLAATSLCSFHQLLCIKQVQLVKFNTINIIFATPVQIYFTALQHIFCNYNNDQREVAQVLFSRVDACVKQIACEIQFYMYGKVKEYYKLCVQPHLCWWQCTHGNESPQVYMYPCFCRLLLSKDHFDTCSVTYIYIPTITHNYQYCCSPYKSS